MFRRITYINFKKINRLNLLIISLFIALLLIGFPGISIEALFHENTSSWKFAVMSDTQGDNRDKDNKSCINDTIIKFITEDIVREKPDFCLVSGDLVNGWFRNGGTDYTIQYANWKSAMRPVYNTGIRVYPIRGNHDNGPERVALPPLPSHLEPPPDVLIQLKKAFRDAFTEPYIPKNGPVKEEGLTYSFSHKNAFIIGLDQYTDGQHKVNQEWLNRQLAGKKNTHVFIFGHEPAFETNHKDNLAFYPKERDLFWDSIGKAGARIYFCGHDHFYNRAMIPDNNGNQIRQVIAGTGGGTLKTWSGTYKDDRVKGEYHNSDYHGYILVTVEGEKVTVVWKALIKSGVKAADIWQITDTFTYFITAK